MKVRTPPSTASITTDVDENGKLNAPSAARNANDVCAAISVIAPHSGVALEIASGTGQHIVTFASAMPHIQWQPTEVEPVRIRSIQAYVHEAAQGNIAQPILLNATQVGWSAKVSPMDLITLANLLHLISEGEATKLIAESAKALKPNGKLFLYGPFRRKGKLTSEGDASFDASIRASDPETGYKDDGWVKDTAQKNSLTFHQAVEMPANNLALVFARKT